MIVTCYAQIIGSYDRSQGTWRWAWDNPSVTGSTTFSTIVRNYGEKHKCAKLTHAEWKATEDDAWTMASIGTLLNGMQGAYRGPAGELYVFLVFDEPRIQKTPNQAL